MAIVDSDKRKVQTMFADMLKYALKLAEEYWTTEMAFRVTGEEDFIHMRPCKLKEIPVVAPATREYIAKATKKAADDYAKQQKAFGVIVPKGALPPGWEPPKYMIYKKNGKEVPREATLTSKRLWRRHTEQQRFLLNAIREAYLAKAVDPAEYRQATIYAHRMLTLDKERKLLIDKGNGRHSRKRKRRRQRCLERDGEWHSATGRSAGGTGCPVVHRCLTTARVGSKPRDAGINGRWARS